MGVKKVQNKIHFVDIGSRRCKRKDIKANAVSQKQTKQCHLSGSSSIVMLTLSQVWMYAERWILIRES